MNVGTYIMLGCVFLAGFVLGGIMVYAWNARSWHLRDLDTILERLSHLDENVERIHSNFKRVVVRFGQFSDHMEADSRTVLTNVMVSGEIQEKEWDFLTSNVLTKTEAKQLSESTKQTLDGLTTLGEDIKERMSHL